MRSFACTSRVSVEALFLEGFQTLVGWLRLLHVYC